MWNLFTIYRQNQYYRIIRGTYKLYAAALLILPEQISLWNSMPLGATKSEKAILAFRSKSRSPGIIGIILKGIILKSLSFMVQKLLLRLKLTNEIQTNRKKKAICPWSFDLENKNVTTEGTNREMRNKVIPIQEYPLVQAPNIIKGKSLSHFETMVLFLTCLICVNYTNKVLNRKFDKVQNIACGIHVA